MRISERRWVLAACCAGTLAGAAATVGAAIFTDGFDSNTIETTWWTIGADGGSSIVATNQRLELTQGAGGFAGLAFNLPIVGDFTVRLDYALLSWPANNRERVALGAMASPSQQLLIERVSDSLVRVGTEIYVTDFTGQGILGTPTTDLSGTLQLERIGDTVRGAYWTGTEWSVIGTYSLAGEGNQARTIGFSIFPGAPVTEGVKVAFDNFYLSGPNVPIPEPGTLSLLGLGAAFLAIIGRRRRR
jgi:hypothetical protein